jgi:hypothetical protein
MNGTQRLLGEMTVREGRVVWDPNGISSRSEARRRSQSSSPEPHPQSQGAGADRDRRFSLELATEEQ